MSETQRYKLATEFTLPTAGIPYLRKMIRARLEVVQAAINDGNARNCFSFDEMSGLCFECLTLAKMLDIMPKDEADHA